MVHGTSLLFWRQSLESVLIWCFTASGTVKPFRGNSP